MLAQQIFKILEPNLRLLKQETNCSHHSSSECFNIHLSKLQQIISTGSPIQFILPAFPAKSPNRNKTMSYLPDLGERLALKFLDNICKEIKFFYEPGAQIIICSDGRVFNDLVKVKDNEVDAYTQAIKNIIQKERLQNVTTFGLDDYYKQYDYTKMRELLVKEYGETLETIKKDIKENDAEKNLFNGIHRFIFEDHLSLLEKLSKNKIRLLTKDTAYQVIQRSHAWSQFVQKKFPQAVRLSIHPQPCGSEKLGIMLLKSKDIWATPWHRVVLFDGKEHLLIKKQEAEAMGGFPVFTQQQFSHYELT